MLDSAWGQCVRSQLGVDLSLVRFVVMHRLGQKLGCELRLVTQDAFSVVRRTPVEGEGPLRQACAGYGGGTAVESRVVVMFG
jgi:hypothetical protein